MAINSKRTHALVLLGQLVLSQKHPSLHLYTHHLTLLHAQLAYWQHNFKFSRALLRRHLASLGSYVHLAQMSHTHSMIPD